MTRHEDLEAKRRGYWLRHARLRRGVTLADAAETAGLAPGSGSTVSLWERGLRPISLLQRKRLAIRYGVPVSWFVDPPMTDEERLTEAIEASVALVPDDAAVEAAADERFAERAAQARPVARTHAAAIGSPAPRAPRKTAG
jgi:transcriptional regulator with XRE-family HTH domain